MSAARSKIFGMDLGVDPKIIILALIVVAGLVYYFTSSSSDSPSNSSGGNSQAASIPAVARPALPLSAAKKRAKGNKIDRDVLKLVPVDGSKGDVDPTLRLALLDRVKNEPPAAGIRNLFDSGGPTAIATNVPPPPQHPPIIKPGPLNPNPEAQNQPPPAPIFNIPLKYYGFAKAKGRSPDASRGLFLDGDNILIGAEGDVLEKRFLIVALTPTSARLEDTQAKQGQDIQVTPEAPTTP